MYGELGMLNAVYLAEDGSRLGYIACIQRLGKPSKLIRCAGLRFHSISTGNERFTGRLHKTPPRNPDSPTAFARPQPRALIGDTRNLSPPSINPT